MISLELLLVVLSIPHIFYFYVWTQSKHFMKMCQKYAKGTDPVLVFSKTAYVIKIVQFITFFLYFNSLGKWDIQEITPLRFVLFVIFTAIGQALNAGIYKAIGVNGVYYGCRLGKKIPWCTGFPFNVVPHHPQYIGSVLSVWGIIVLLANGPQHQVLYLIGSVWTLYYVITAAVEQYM